MSLHFWNQCKDIMVLMHLLQLLCFLLIQSEGRSFRESQIEALNHLASFSSSLQDLPPFCIYQAPPSDAPPSPPSSSQPSPSAYVPCPPDSTPPPPSSSPVSFVPSPTDFTPGPPIFLPPVVYPPPLAPPPPPLLEAAQRLWCVAKPAVPDPIIQEAMDYACGTGADCGSIRPDGSCFQPETVIAHASFAFNSYWQGSKVAGGTCDFGGAAVLVTEDPSYDGCIFIIT